MELQMKYPIIQAPMAGGITTNELIIAVTKAGGLGMIGAGYMTTEAITKQIEALHKENITYFGINLFVPQAFTTIQADVDATIAKLNQLFPATKINSETSLPTYEQLSKQFNEQIGLIIEKKLPICSFTFGIPSEEVIHKLKAANILVMATATTPEEARLIEAAGFDYIVLQSSEAGGHRGSFTKSASKYGITLAELIKETKKKVTKPLIASGGIMNQAQLNAALNDGASAVQLGTAFLTCHESGANPVHKRAITKATKADLTITRSFSGKWAQGIRNHFITSMQPIEASLPAFPIQNTLTQGIRKIAAQNNNPDLMSLWSGQNLDLAKQQSVADLMNELVNEITP